MKKTINFNEFCEEFKNYNRDENFSYEGKKALFEYLESYEEDIGKEIELDIISLCCEYTEYVNLEEFHGVYDSGDYPDLESVRDATTVIEIEGREGFIVQDF